MRRARPRQVLIGLAAAAVLLTLLDQRDSDSGPIGALRTATDTVIGPLQDLVGGAANGVADAAGRLGDGEADEQLQAQNAELNRRIVELEDRAAAGDQLADLLALQRSADLTTVPARVVALSRFQPFAATVTIDVGSRDGVRADMTVTSGAGLVGKVVRTGPFTSTVAVLSDPVFSTGVRITGVAGSFGLAEGDGEGRMTLRLVQLPGGRELQVGAALVTSGEGTIIGGIPVGRVVQVNAGSSTNPGGSRTAVIEPFAALGGVDLVQVVLDGPREQPRAPLTPEPQPS